MSSSYIYIITDGDAYKVGISVNPEKRIKSLQTGSPKSLKILELFKLPKDRIHKIEKECHKALQTRFVKRGEWFHGATAFSVRIIVDEICEPFIITDQIGKSDS